MTFNSLEFAVFFVTVLAVYWSVRPRAQNVVLLAASWAFYATFDWRFLGLMLLSTVVDFQVGRALVRLDDERRRRLVLLASLVVNLGVLGGFKYAGFFVDSAARVLEGLGVSSSRPTLHVLLPVGISFYTFHGISYTVDVFRRHIEPCRRFVDFAVFVAYFPQLVAGPIGRAQVQLPQFHNPRSLPSRRDIDSAVVLIVTGLFKKVAVADALAPHVDRAFAAAPSAGWTTLVVGALGFTLQIYADFSGYTDIARGTSRLLGIELPRNFTEPFLARDITEFWHRWHISLSTWLRDYLYVPLGGNRAGRGRTYRNLLITMVIGGLWHGAATTFVAWGAIHGVLLVGHRLWRARAGPARAEPRGRAGALAGVAGTFLLVAAAFVVFRSPSLTVATQVLGGILTARPGPVVADAVLTVAAAAIALLALDGASRLWRAGRLSLRPVPIGATVGAMLVAIIVFSGGAPVPFIYFKF